MVNNNSKYLSNILGIEEHLLSECGDLSVLEEIVDCVKQCLSDESKVQDWFSIPNPMLGDVMPRYMLLVGRVDKLLQFVKTAAQEYQSPGL